MSSVNAGCHEFFAALHTVIPVYQLIGKLIAVVAFVIIQLRQQMGASTVTKLSGVPIREGDFFEKVCSRAGCLVCERIGPPCFVRNGGQAIVRISQLADKGLYICRAAIIVDLPHLCHPVRLIGLWLPTAARNRKGIGRAVVCGVVVQVIDDVSVRVDNPGQVPIDKLFLIPLFIGEGVCRARNGQGIPQSFLIFIGCGGLFLKVVLRTIRVGVHIVIGRNIIRFHGGFHHRFLDGQFPT